MISLDYRTFDASHLCMNSSSPANMYNKIHVLLVEHESVDLDNIMNMLRCFSFEVTSVNHAASGISVLSKEKAEFDMVIANMSSPDSFGYQLLQLALKMNLLVILTSKEEDALRTMRALEEGSFVCVRKPLTMQVMGYLWQHDNLLQQNQPYNEEEEEEVVNYINPHPYPNHLLQQEPPTRTYFTTKRKVWTEWTEELHAKFMQAARYLGPGKCYPKDILELMNVPGLTRMQVASHLQKCRNARWLPPQQRKSKHAYEEIPSSAVHPPKPKKTPRARPACFGIMPYMDDDVSPPPPVQQMPAAAAAAASDPYNPPITTHVEGSNMLHQGYMINPDPYGLLNVYHNNNNSSFTVGQQQPGLGGFGGGMQDGHLFDLPPIIDAVDPLDDLINELGFDYDAAWQWKSLLAQDNVLDQVEIMATHDVGNQSQVGNVAAAANQYWAYGGNGYMF